MHWNDMSVSMWCVAAGEQERDAIDFVDCFDSFGEMLAEDYDSTCQMRWYEIKGFVVLLRDDVTVPAPDRSDVQERQDLRIFVQDYGVRLPASYFAECAIVHGYLPRVAWSWRLSMTERDLFLSG